MMKKKILSILFIGILLIGLTGCGSMSKKSMIDKSTKLNIKQLNADLESNFKTAKDKYKGNIYEINAGIISVEDKFAKIELYNIDVSSSYLEVYFNNSDLQKIKSGQKIKFVGKISDIIKEEDDFIVKVKKAYFVSDFIEITGKVSFHDATKGYKKYSYIYDYYNDNENDKTTYDINNFTTINSYSKANINGTEVENKSTITIKAKVVETDDNTAYDDMWTITEIKSIKVIE